MPRYDGTGPNSRGPLTGWGMGYCVDPVKASFNPVKPVETAVPVRPFYGRGFGRGRGRGRGWGRGRGRY